MHLSDSSRSKQNSVSPLDWNAFDSQAYLNQNYAFVRDDDRALLSLTVDAFRGSSDLLDIVDIGTGPNLYPLLAMLPRARSLTAWEISSANVAWLKAEVAAPALRPVWQAFWEIVRDLYAEPLPPTPQALLRSRLTQTLGSVFDLPHNHWDAASMFFCAESITNSMDEFERALLAWARCVKPGGRLVAAFMENSLGYTVGDRSYPAMCLTREALAAAISPLLSDAVFTYVARPPSGREGYTGMVFAHGRAR
jgi:SAM-dependent methyltransferase